MTPRLVSFPLCPFIQKAVIAMNQKRADYAIEYIDLANPPDWFRATSPLGQVPLLYVGDTVLFESEAILEYLDEAWSPPLHPMDPLERARNRSWMAFANTCLWDTFHLGINPSREAFRQTLFNLHRRLDVLEDALHDGPWFNGGEFSLVDVAFAPLFQRLAVLDRLRPGVLQPGRQVRVNAWAMRLAGHTAVRESTVSGFEALYHDLIRHRRGYMAGLLEPVSGRKDDRRGSS